MRRAAGARPGQRFETETHAVSQRPDGKPSYFRHRAVWMSITLMFLLLGLWGFQHARGLAAPPKVPLSFPIVLEGRSIAQPDELRFRLQARALGDTVRIETTVGPRLLVLEPQYSEAHFAITLASALLFFAVNLFVFCTRLDRPGARSFYAATLLFGLAILINGPRLPPKDFFPHGLLTLVWLGALTALPVLYARLGANFPHPHPLTRRHRLIVPLVIVAGVVLFLTQVWAYMRVARSQGPGVWVAWKLARASGELFLVAATGFGSVLLFGTLRRLELARERRQLKALLFGFVVGLTPYVLLRVLPRAFGVAPPLDPAVDRIFELAIPLAFTLAVVQHQFLDIDIILRRSLIYTTAAALFALVPIGILVIGGRTLGVPLPRASMGWILLCAALAVVLFPITRDLVSRWVDRTFFQIRTHRVEALAELRNRLPAEATQLGVGRVLHHVLNRELEPARLVVVAFSPARVEVAGDVAEDWFLNRRAALDQLPIGDSILAAPHSSSLPEIEATFPDELKDADIRMVVRIRAAETPLGWILLGPRRSDRRYVEEDLELLRGAAVEAGRALDRLRLSQQLAREAFERQRLDDLNRARVELLARISHDLRTPLASIGWSAQNLLDGVAGPITPRQNEYLDAIRISSGHLGRMVTSLLEISRAESSSTPVERTAVPLRTTIDDALKALRPLAERKGLTLEFPIGDEVRVLAEPGRLFEIVTNLIENAIKFSPDAAAIELHLRRTGERAELVIRDHGPGLAAEDLKHLFEPFRRGEAQSRADGFGLGLYVVRSFLTQLGGTIAADNHPEGGASFVVSLPLA